MTGLDFLKEYLDNPSKYLPLSASAIRMYPPREPESGDVNIGWNCGLVDGNRPYFSMCWAPEGITMMTFHISKIGLEDYTPTQVDALCEAHHLYHRISNKYSPAVYDFVDKMQNHFYSVNVVVGLNEDDEIHVDNTAKSYPFAILNTFLQQRLEDSRSSSGLL